MSEKFCKNCYIPIKNNYLLCYECNKKNKKYGGYLLKDIARNDINNGYNHNDNIMKKCTSCQYNEIPVNPTWRKKCTTCYVCEL